MSVWKAEGFTHNGKLMYHVFRLRNRTAPDTQRNREYFGMPRETREEAEIRAEQLNEMEAEEKWKD